MKPVPTTAPLVSLIQYPAGASQSKTNHVIAMAAKRAVVSPLHRVIDAGRWDAEPHVGRLIILIHAAFVDAGFVPLPVIPGGDGQVPREIGPAASSLSRRYTAPQLQDHPDAVIDLRLRPHRLRIHLSVARGTNNPRLLLADRNRFAVDDAVAAALLLPGDLDAAARALRRDPRVAALWCGLTGDLCRPALEELCSLHGVALEPTLLSLPTEVLAAVLARLVDGRDLARAELTCGALRRIVAERDRELWKPLYDAVIGYSVWMHDATDSPRMRWKRRYVNAWLARLPTELRSPSSLSELRAARVASSSEDFVRSKAQNWLIELLAFYDHDD